MKREIEVAQAKRETLQAVFKFVNSYFWEVCEEYGRLVESGAPRKYIEQTRGEMNALETINLRIGSMIAEIMEDEK